MEKNIKKSELYAEGELEYRQLCFRQPGLLECTMEEEKEDILFRYDTAGYESFNQIHGESRKDILCALLSAAELSSLSAKYLFHLEPDNLFYDRCRRTAVMERDLYERGSAPEEKNFLMEYQSLAGFALQKKYSYEDYLNGGRDLFSKNRFMRKIGEAESMEAITELLEQEYKRLDADEKENKLLVGKSWYHRNRWYFLISMILLITAAIYTVYEQGVRAPRKEAMLQAADNFTANDYLKVIDSLKTVKTDQIESAQQYMLAVSYVKSENLTMEQKENILGTLTLGGDRKLIRYWISLGRLELAEAENIAMQKSDDELLLYAYLKEKSMVETDQSLNGEEKAAKLESLQSKIDSLSKQYNLEEQEE